MTVKLNMHNPSVLEKFDYSSAFCRTLGWIVPSEQLLLKKSRVAIAGMGGVGGAHLLTLVRLGIGSFHISDFDVFELQNFNRQAGADMTSLCQPKVEVMRQRALDINPELEIISFREGVQENNIDKFLEGVDIYVDGLDVFALDLREVLFRACAERGIPALTVAPIGMGAAFVGFDPNGMTFEQYFGFQGRSQIEKYCRLVLGVSPNFLHLKSLVDRSYANAYKNRAPSIPMGCEIAAGVMGTEVLKHILNRGNRLVAPWSMQFDAYSYRLRKSWMPCGSYNPFFRLKLKILKFMIDQQNK